MPLKEDPNLTTTATTATAEGMQDMDGSFNDRVLMLSTRSS